MVRMLICFAGGMNNQSYKAAGLEANLDTQFAFGLSWPTPGTFYSTSGKPPFHPDTLYPDDTNEPYAKVRLTHRKFQFADLYDHSGSTIFSRRTSFLSQFLLVTATTSRLSHTPMRPVFVLVWQLLVLAGSL